MKEKYVEEHLTVYSRANPKEHRWTQLRMLFIREHTSEMDEVIEFFSTAGRSQSYPFQVHMLRRINECTRGITRYDMMYPGFGSNSFLGCVVFTVVGFGGECRPILAGV